MEVAVLILLVIFVTLSASQVDVINREFLKWMDTYNKTYTTKADFNNAFANFKTSYQQMMQQKLHYNCKRSRFLLRLNEFSGDNSTTKSKRNGFEFSKVNSIINSGNAANGNGANGESYPPAPDSLDYRTQSLVTSVGDQGYYCASCYAFSALCALEGQAAKATGMLRKLSEQNLVDCSEQFGNSGCNGGFMGASYEYILTNSGIENDTTYPYDGVAGSCSYTPGLAAQNIASYNYVIGDEENLKQALAYIGPLAVALRGDLPSFYGYGGGIYDDLACNGYLNHAGCLVGYGTDNTTSPPTDYWILKNSWSPDWGEGGYIRILRGSNLCGITTYVVYPNLPV